MLIQLSRVERSRQSLRGWVIAMVRGETSDKEVPENDPSEYHPAQFHETNK